MEFRHLALFCLIAILGSYVHASSIAGQKHWQSIWPNTPMPKALQELTKIGLWNGRPSPPGINRPAKVGNNKVDRVNLDYNYGGFNDIIVPRKVKDTLNLTTYFFEHDLRPGKKFNLEFTKRSDEFTFLPQKIAKSIPFSSNKFSEVLNYFGIQAKSAEAETLKYTLEFCENPRIYCASSLESLIDFTVLKLGKDVRVLATELEKESEKQEKKEYSVEEGVEKVGDREVVCHKLNYAYAVFYCHKVSATRAYSVSLVASDRTKAKALVVCHTDTESWNPEHMAFKVLKVKPGSRGLSQFAIFFGLIPFSGYPIEPSRWPLGASLFSLTWGFVYKIKKNVIHVRAKLPL